MEKTNVTVVQAFQPDMKKTIDGRIAKLAKSEKVTKAELQELSREIITYISLNGSPDVGVLNRLLGVLTPGNADISRLYFKEFIPHKLNEDGTFGVKVKGDKKVAEILAKAKDWLSKPENNIWSWSKDNVSVEKAFKPYDLRISDLVGRALSAEGEKHVTEAGVISAIIQGGVKVESILDVLKSLKTAPSVATPAVRKAAG